MTGIDRSRMYLHEDVHILANQVSPYLPNMGSHWPFSEDIRHDLVGIFGQLRPCGQWPRAVNLWEVDWPRLAAQLTEQFGEARVASPEFETWWRRSLTQRKGGFDRFMFPGPGSPSLAEIQTGEQLPCVLQQKSRVRHGAAEDYLANFAERAARELAGSPWQPLMWFTCMHSAETFVYLAGPSWDGVLDVAAILPGRDPSWGQTALLTSALKPWEHSRYLQR
jgi:hypothetical protein